MAAMSSSDEKNSYSEQQRSSFSPSEFMRTRRPEQYSDSYKNSAPILDKVIFEYHLDTLTSRSEEKVFEHFCRKLAQKELCPNLLPQTGPTGGGDSKVDTETYPVSEEISERWYEGSASAAKDRWAFAFSAKKAWKPKVKSDVQKIIGTNRDYSLIYFISNQFVRDKDRADMEDTLSSDHDVQVRILDRNWIVEKVYDNSHLELAIEALSIPMQPHKPTEYKGVNDIERKAELDELESNIANQDYYAGVEYQLVEDCLCAAILSRELEINRTETEGRFLRAERLAKKLGYPQQQMKVKYQYAWTACFWFDDFELVDDLYDGLEKFSIASTQAADLERLSNIWQLIFNGVRFGYLAKDAARLDERTQALKESLRKLSFQQNRLNNATHAKTLLCTIELSQRVLEPEKIGPVLKELAEIFQMAEYLGGYPFDKFADLFTEMGDFIGGHPEYDKTFEILLPILERRRSEEQAGRMLLERGLQKFTKEQPYEAIKLLGRAQAKLLKHECQEDLVYSLVFCAKAYESVGLIWAAHANLLAAASIGLTEFSNNGIVTRDTFYSILRLIWTELQLGRVPQILTYMEFATSLSQHLKLSDKTVESFNKQLQDQDAILGMLMLRASIPQLEILRKLPKALEMMGLFLAEMALLFALGDEEALVSEGLIPAGTPSEELEETFTSLAMQPASNDIAKKIEIFDMPTIEMRSSVLGCQWRVEADNNQTSIRISEAFLGFIESFFATSLEGDAVPHRQEIRIRIQQGEASDDHADIQVSVNNPDYILVVEHSPTYDPTRKPMDGGFQKHLLDIIAILLPRTLYVPNMEAYLDRITKNEGGFSRSLTFSDVFSAASNVLGNTPVYTIAEWLVTEHEYKLNRTKPLDLDLPKKPKRDGKPSYTVGEPPPELLTTDGLKHGQRKVLSYIDNDLWNSAKWSGAAVALFPNYPPVLALLFRDKVAARAIFENWIQKIGSKDEDDQLRVCIVTGVDKDHPSSYKILISANLDYLLQDIDPLDQVITMSRVQHMDNPSPDNLQMLIKSYETYGCYVIAPAIYDPSKPQPEIQNDMGILKRPLVVRPAWEIGEHDVDLAAITLKDNPIIPAGITDAPVLRLLARRKKMGE